MRRVLPAGRRSAGDGDPEAHTATGENFAIAFACETRKNSDCVSLLPRNSPENPRRTPFCGAFFQRFAKKKRDCVCAQKEMLATLFHFGTFSVAAICGAIRRRSSHLLDPGPRSQPCAVFAARRRVSSPGSRPQSSAR